MNRENKGRGHVPLTSDYKSLTGSNKTISTLTITLLGGGEMQQKQS